MDYYLYESEVLVDRFSENVAWDVTKLSINQSYDFYPSDYNSSNLDSFSFINVCMTLRRKSRFYWLYILIPCLVLNTMGIGIFIFPVGTKEKVSFGWGILLILFVFTLVVHGILPKTSDYVPLLGEHEQYLEHFLQKLLQQYI